MAVAHGHLQTARMLLDAGAASLPDADGRIPPQINHCSVGARAGGRFRGKEQKIAAAAGSVPVDPGHEPCDKPAAGSAGYSAPVGAVVSSAVTGAGERTPVSDDDRAGAGREERSEWEQVGRAALEQLLRSMSQNCELELVNVVAAAAPAPASWREGIMTHRLALLEGREGESVREQQRLEEVSKQREQAAAAAEYERRVHRVRQKKHEQEMKVVAAEVARHHACRVICGAFALLKRRREHEREEAQRALAASKLEANRRKELRAREMDAAAAIAAAAAGAATSAAATQFDRGAEGPG